jgi:hypothetical protein
MVIADALDVYCKIVGIADGKKSEGFVMQEIRAQRIDYLLAVLARGLLVSSIACASEKSVDRGSKVALGLDVHPDRGATQCAR